MLPNSEISQLLDNFLPLVFTSALASKSVVLVPNLFLQVGLVSLIIQFIIMKINIRGVWKEKIEF
jgi:hypothetical protein